MNLESFPWIFFIVFVVIGLLALGLALPRSTKIRRWIIAALLLILTIAVGILLALSDGIQVSALASWSTGEIGTLQILERLSWAILLGICIGAILLVTLRLFTRIALPQLRARFIEEAKFPLWKRFVIAIYSAILEETIYRLLLLSLIAWLLGLVWHTAARYPTNGAFWISNVMAAIMFGLVHLPRWSSLTRLTPGLVVAVISLNGLGGLAFGYLFFTYGIEAAIIAHFLGDTVLHTIGPNLLSR